MPPSPQTTKLTSTLRLLIPRLRLLQKKDTASSVIQRRELSALLDEGRESSARIRVENVIATDIGVEVMEMVELYCELLLARANVLDQVAFGEKGNKARLRARDVGREVTAAAASAASGAAGLQGEGRKGSGILGFGGFKSSKQDTSTTADKEEGVLEEDTSLIDPAIDEAAAAIFYAYPRFPHDVRELTLLRSHLAERYGKDFMTLAADNKYPDVSVPERLVKGCRIKPPSTELVESYLVEIARAYKVSWPRSNEEISEGVPGEFEGDENNTPPLLPTTPRSKSKSKPDNDDHDDDDTGDIGDNGRPGEMRRRASEASELNRTTLTPPRGSVTEGKRPVSIAPPGPRLDNPNPHIKIPGEEEEKQQQQPPKATRNNSGGGGGSGIPELDELTKRFAALRR